MAKPKAIKCPKVLLHCGECAHVLMSGPKAVYCRNNHCPQFGIAIATSDEPPAVA